MGRQGEGRGGIEGIDEIEGIEGIDEIEGIDGIDEVNERKEGVGMDEIWK